MGRAKRTAGWGGGEYSANAVKGRLGKLPSGRCMYGHQVDTWEDYRSSLHIRGGPLKATDCFGCVVVCSCNGMNSGITGRCDPRPPIRGHSIRVTSEVVGLWGVRVEIHLPPARSRPIPRWAHNQYSLLSSLDILVCRPLGPLYKCKGRSNNGPARRGRAFGSGAAKLYHPPPSIELEATRWKV